MQFFVWTESDGSRLPNVAVSKCLFSQSPFISNYDGFFKSNTVLLRLSVPVQGLDRGTKCTIQHHAASLRFLTSFDEEQV